MDPTPNPGHQAFFTEEALQAISRTTLGNISDFQAGRPLAVAAQVA